MKVWAIIIAVAIVFAGLSAGVYLAIRGAQERAERAEIRAYQLEQALKAAMEQAQLNKQALDRLDELKGTLLAAEAALHDELSRPPPAPIVRIIHKPAADGGPAREVEIMDFAPVVDDHRARVERVRHIVTSANGALEDAPSGQPA